MYGEAELEFEREQIQTRRPQTNEYIALLLFNSPQLQNFDVIARFSSVCCSRTNLLASIRAVPFYNS